jgi:membrane-bound lytic murein transglycosylase B
MPFAHLRTAGLLAVLLLVVSGGTPAPAQTPQAETPETPIQPFADWLLELKTEALERGISEPILGIALNGVEPIPRVIELDRNQPEFTLTFQQYLTRVVPDHRIATGRRKLTQNRALLNDVYRIYGVPPHMIVALWAIETDFGRLTGGFKVVPALATLAHDGRRSAFFRKELLDALTILDEGHIKPADMAGSWAGAMGQCQFMPSSFLNFAVDHDGDGRKDIWKTRADIFASAANLLASHGWERGWTWGRPVRLPDVFDLGVEGLDNKKPLAEWQALGIRRTDGRDLPNAEIDASLIMPDGPDGAVFLVYDNFRVILHWNRSDYFALTVGYLADRIAGKNTVIFR